MAAEVTEQSGQDAAVAIAKKATRAVAVPLEHTGTLMTRADIAAEQVVYALTAAGLLVSAPGDAGNPRSNANSPSLAVTRAQVRAAASALFEWNNELVDDPRFTLHHVTGGVDREPYGALIDEVLHHLGIRVQEGN